MGATTPFDFVTPDVSRHTTAALVRRVARGLTRPSTRSSAVRVGSKPGLPAQVTFGPESDGHVALRFSVDGHSDKNPTNHLHANANPRQVTDLAGVMWWAQWDSNLRSADQELPANRSFSNEFYSFSSSFSLIRINWLSAQCKTD